MKNTSKLSKIYVTELGHIMAKIYYPKKRISINYKIGNVEELLENKKLDGYFWVQKKLIYLHNNKINMELNEKLELNKQIRQYKGDNSFVLSLQKQLKTNKFLEKVEVGGRMIKILSEKQYQAAKTAF